jgi:hypothetical protein
MNDAQKDKMVAALAQAFDKAATKCGTSWHAALFIESELRNAGFHIAMRKSEK